MIQRQGHDSNVGTNVKTALGNRDQASSITTLKGGKFWFLIQMKQGLYSALNSLFLLSKIQGNLMKESPMGKVPSLLLEAIRRVTSSLQLIKVV